MHFLRRLPMNFSQIPFACGVRYGVFSPLICVAYLLPQSHIRYFESFPRVLLPVTAIPSIHRLDISLLLYALSAAFSGPSHKDISLPKQPDVYYPYAQVFPAWFSKKVTQLWFNKYSSYLSTCISKRFVYLSSIPSFSNSPQIRSAPP
jgi:hypothetical protein